MRAVRTACPTLGCPAGTGPRHCRRRGRVLVGISTAGGESQHPQPQWSGALACRRLRAWAAAAASPISKSESKSERLDRDSEARVRLYRGRAIRTIGHIHLGLTHLQDSDWLISRMSQSESKSERLDRDSEARVRLHRGRAIRTIWAHKPVLPDTSADCAVTEAGYLSRRQVVRQPRQWARR